MSYVGNVLIGVDMLASTIIPGGVPGETLSARAGSAYMQNRLRGQIFCPVIDVIMHIFRQYPTWRGHCVHAFDVGDVQRARRVLSSKS